MVLRDLAAHGYPVHMIGIRLAGLLLFGLSAAAQQPPFSRTGEPSISEPRPPVIDDKACPDPYRADGAPQPVQKIKRNDRLYSSWGGKRVSVGTLKVGDQVTVLSGVNVIREPDKVRVLQPSPPGEVPPLKPGEEVLGYGLRDGGDYVFWAKGVWYTEYYEFEGDLKGGCGFRDGMCSFAISKRGIHEWWVHVKTSSGLVGWVLAGKNVHNKSWQDGNFYDLCILD